MQITTPEVALAVANAHSTIAAAYMKLADDLQNLEGDRRPVAPTQKSKSPPPPHHTPNQHVGPQTGVRAKFRAALLAAMTEPGVVYDTDTIRAQIGVQEHENNLYDWALVDLQGKSPLKLTPMIRKIAKKRYMLI